MCEIGRGLGRLYLLVHYVKMNQIDAAAPQNPRELLLHIQAELTQHSIVDVSAINLDYINEFATALRQWEPFSRFNACWMLSPQGGAINGAYSNAPFLHVLARTARGDNIDDVLKSVSDQIEANFADLIEVTEIRGVTIKEITQIAENTWIYPNSALPKKGRYWSAFSRTHALGVVFHAESAALVQRVRLEPCAVPLDDEDTYKKALQRYSAEMVERTSYRKIVRRALILSSTGPVELGWNYTTSEADNIFADFGMMSSGLDNFSPMGDVEIDGAVASEMLKKLHEFKSTRSLNVAIDRFGSSYTTYDREDIAIDLGIAMEAALMHDDDDPKGEINVKLGLRAGWLLGDDLASRKAFKKKSNELYSARSAAAHGGTVSDKFDINQSRNFIRAVLLSILRRGKFPVWGDLMFGDGSPALVVIEAEPLPATISTTKSATKET